MKRHDVRKTVLILIYCLLPLILFLCFYWIAVNNIFGIGNDNYAIAVFYGLTFCLAVMPSRHKWSLIVGLLLSSIIQIVVYGPGQPNHYVYFPRFDMVMFFYFLPFFILTLITMIIVHLVAKIKRVIVASRVDEP